MSTFAGFADLVHGPDSQWGALSCGCHPNCGVGTALMINKETKEWAPVPRFLDAPQLVRTSPRSPTPPAARSFSNFMMALALLKNYKPFQGPQSLDAEGPLQEIRQDLGAHQGLGEEVRQDFARTARTKTP